MKVRFAIAVYDLSSRSLKAQQLQHRVGRFLLRALAATAGSCGLTLHRGNGTAHGKLLLMFGTADSGNGVFRQSEVFALKIFLQPRFGILQRMSKREFGNTLIEPRKDTLFANGIAAIEQDGPDNGLNGIGKIGIALRTTGFALASTHAQVLLDAKLPRDKGQRGAAHQLRPQTAQVTFRRLRKTPVNHAGNDKIQESVTEVFETLIVISTKTAVRQRQLQQGFIAKPVSKLLFWRWLQLF